MECSGPAQAAIAETYSTDVPDSDSRTENSTTNPADPAGTERYPAPAGIDCYPDNESVKSKTASDVIDSFLDTCSWYQCAGREAQVAEMRIAQTVWDRVAELERRDDRIIPILTGSFAEGMPLEICGDLDIMMSLQKFPVVLCEPPPEDTTSHKAQTWFLVAENNQRQPAYIKLSVCGDISDIGRDDIEQCVIHDRKGQWLSGQSLMRTSTKEKFGIHGPALTREFDESEPSVGTFDSVLCLRCPTWPPCAADFLHRPRSQGTPSQSLIQTIAAAGCHVVATGHPDSEDRDLEWRWSFSVAEKEIIHDMDRAMAGAMYVLKVLKKHIWTDDNIPVEICSYFFKTACLFVNERVPHTDKTSSLALARHAIDWLIQRYLKHRIPHFFIHNQNLIGHLPQDTCTEMAHTLIDVKSQLQRYVLCGLQKDPVIAEVVHFIHDSISFSPRSDDLDVNTGVFITALLEQGNVGQVLEATSGRIRPGNDTYRQKEWDFNSFAIEWIPAVVPDVLLLTETPLELVQIPEDVLMPVIDNIDHIVKAEFVAMYVSILHRILGLKYLALSFYIAENHSSDSESSSEYKGPAQDDKTPSGDSTMENKNTPSTEDATGSKEHSPVLSAERRCLVKSEEFLHKGIPLVLHNGFDDKGLSGYVHLTIYYFLIGQWDEALTASKQTFNIIDDVDDLKVHVNGFPPIYTDLTSTLGNVFWKQDENLYQCLKQSGLEKVCFNPIPLTYYFQARLALRQGDAGLAQAALGQMIGMNETLLEFYQTSTDILIETAVCQLSILVD